LYEDNLKLSYILSIRFRFNRLNRFFFEKNRDFFQPWVWGRRDSET